jgi:hypothetical protein
MEALPETEQAVISTAGLLFERAAIREGFDVGEIDTPGTAAALAFEHAMHRALGGRVVNGERRGGIGPVNGRPTLIPHDMSADEVQTRLSLLNDAQLEKLPPILSANGVPVSAAQIRGATLVSIGDGKYHVATGDMATGDPQFVMGENGALWTLDVRALEDDRAALRRWWRQ